MTSRSCERLRLGPVPGACDLRCRKGQGETGACALSEEMIHFIDAVSRMRKKMLFSAKFKMEMKEQSEGPACGT